VAEHSLGKLDEFPVVPRQLVTILEKTSLFAASFNIIEGITLLRVSITKLDTKYPSG
jgi:hypothetical protein